MIFFMVDSIKRSKVCSCHAKPQFQNPSVFCWCSSALNCVKEFNEKAIDLTRFKEKFLNKEPQCRKNTRWQRVKDEKPIQQQWRKSEKKQPKKKVQDKNETKKNTTERLTYYNTMVWACRCARVHENRNREHCTSLENWYRLICSMRREHTHGKCIITFHQIIQFIYSLIKCNESTAYKRVNMNSKNFSSIEMDCDMLDKI